MRDATPYVQRRPEEWRVIARAPDFAVSSHGNVRRIRGSKLSAVGRLKKLTLSEFGYSVVGLWFRGKTRTYFVSHLVCEAFNGLRPTIKHQAAHYDGDRLNNYFENLRWATAFENSQDKYRHGTMLRGDSCPYAKLTNDAVFEIRHARKDGSVIAMLSAKFGVTKNHIAKIRTPSRGIWPDVPFPEHRT